MLFLMLFCYSGILIHSTGLSSRLFFSSSWEMKIAFSTFLSAMRPQASRPASSEKLWGLANTCTVISREHISCIKGHRRMKIHTTNLWSEYMCSHSQQVLLILIVCTKEVPLPRNASGTSYSPAKQRVTMKTSLIERTRMHPCFVSLHAHACTCKNNYKFVSFN